VGVAVFFTGMGRGCKSEIGQYDPPSKRQERGRSSGVEHNLAKVGVEGSNPFARSRFFQDIKSLRR
jgi:hypothetical protein